MAAARAQNQGMQTALGPRGLVCRKVDVDNVRIVLIHQHMPEKLFGRPVDGSLSRSDKCLQGLDEAKDNVYAPYDPRYKSRGHHRRDKLLVKVGSPTPLNSSAAAHD